MKKQNYWLAAAGLAALAFTAIPAQAHTDVSIGLGLGGPSYYEEPYYAPQPRVVYEESYYEPERAYYGHRYCPPRQVYYRGHHGHGWGHYRHHERYWDDD